jgi:sugar/nucleoside kinase (ribokinase family)
MSFPDLNGPAGKADWSAILTRTLPFVDIFTPSIEEILLLLKPDIYRSTMMTVEAGALDNIITPKILETLGSELLDLGVKIVVIKLGDRGLYLRTAAENQLSKLGIAGAQNCSGWADRELWAPCFAVDVVGATGSGDATIAGFLMGLLRNMPVENCMTSACAVGASCVEAADSLSGVRTWQETSERITAGWPRRKFPIDERGWGWMETEAVWRGPNDQRSA